MAKKTNKHIGHYISLILILGLGFIALRFSYPNRKLEVSVLVLTVIFYVTWGIVHHAINHSLNSKIVVEYILIGSLGIAALVFLIMGAFGI